MKKNMLKKALPSTIFSLKLILLTLALVIQAGALSAQKKALKAATNSNSSLFINKDGDVGVGTDSPTAKLDVRGDVDIAGNAVVKGSLDVNNTASAERSNIFGDINFNGGTLFFKPGNDPNAFIKWGQEDTFGLPPSQDDKMAIAGYDGVKIGNMSKYNKFFPIIKAGFSGQNAVVDIMTEQRSGTHPTNLVMYVTGNMNDIGKGVEFRNSDGDKGIGFTKETIYGTGNGQNMNFSVPGTGNFTFSAKNEQRMFINSEGTIGIMRDLFVGDLEAHPTFKVGYSSGFVGIGTATPGAPLFVNKTIGNDNKKYNQDDNKAFDLLLINAGTAYRTDGKFGSCSIYAIGDIVSKTGFVGAESATFSDIRLKKNLKLSSSVQDLDILRQVQVTDYKMIDTIANNRSYKKVIAQQVQKVYPKAVSSSFGTLPDVFQRAVTVTKQTDSLFLLKLAKPTQLKVGDKLELKCAEAGDAIVIVTQLINDRSFIVRTNVELAKQRNIFVYGHPSKDVLTVDYEAISMLNVSATQQLANTIDEQQKQMAELKRQNDRLLQTVNDVMTRLQKVEKTKSQNTMQVASVNK